MIVHCAQEYIILGAYVVDLSIVGRYLTTIRVLPNPFRLNHPYGKQGSGGTRPAIKDASMVRLSLPPPSNTHHRQSLRFLTTHQRPCYSPTHSLSCCALDMDSFAFITYFVRDEAEGIADDVPVSKDSSDTRFGTIAWCVVA